MPEPDILNPFTDDDFDQIEQSLARSLEVEEAIKKAQRAGIEVPGLLEDVRKTRTRLQQVKQTYFPDRQ
ncbi:MAG: hypothetical protein ACE5OQ_11535 [Woeseia sp.]